MEEPLSGPANQASSCPASTDSRCWPGQSAVASTRGLSSTQLMDRARTVPASKRAPSRAAAVELPAVLELLAAIGALPRTAVWICRLSRRTCPRTHSADGGLAAVASALTGRRPDLADAPGPDGAEVRPVHRRGARHPRPARHEAFRDLRFYASGHGPRSAAAVQVRHRAPGPRCPRVARLRLHRTPGRPTPPGRAGARPANRRLPDSHSQAVPAHLGNRLWA